MKKIKQTMLMIAMILATACTLTSCEDEAIASTLEGTWEGDMYTQIDYRGRHYISSFSELCFKTDPFKFKSGYGYWVDHFSGAPWDYIANHISWEVRDRVIYIYLEEDRVEMQIRNYSLSDNRFRGEVFASDGSWREFRLIHTSSPNWDNYNWGYDPYYDPYWAPSKDGKAPVQSEKPVRIVRGVNSK